MKIHLRLLRKMGEVLTDRFYQEKSGRDNRKLHQELLSLSSGKRTEIREYYIRKAELLIIVVLLGFLATGIAWTASLHRKQEIEGQILYRPGYGEGDREEELSLLINGEETTNLEITVQERKYTQTEQLQLLKKAAEELDTLILGDNPSPDEVRSKLNLPEKMEGGQVQISWSSSPFGIIQGDGTLQNPEEETGKKVELQGILTFGENEEVYTRQLTVRPSWKTEEERFLSAVKKEVQRQNLQDQEKETLKLPEQVEGKHLIWERGSDQTVSTLFGITLFLAVCCYVGMDQRIHEQAQKRTDQLGIDYPDLMWKLSMLMSAGLTIKGSFVKIASQYRRSRMTKKRYVYEEILTMCYEMQSGIFEAEAYERLGRRCGTPEYVRLGSYLSQNLKKGSRGLCEFMVSEAAASLENRKKQAKKLGEKAGTKLLLPMVLMLMIVMIVLIVPAFLSM